MLWVITIHYTYEQDFMDQINVIGPFATEEAANMFWNKNWHRYARDVDQGAVTDVQPCK